MVCPQCNARAESTKQQCRLRTCKFCPRCHFHTDVEVKRSTIPGAGRGLFAKHLIKKGTQILDYKVGTKKLTAAQYKAKYPKGESKPEKMAKIEGNFYDAENAKKSVAGFVNRPPKGGRSNAKLQKNGKVVVTKNLKSDDEIFMPYGTSFRIAK